MASREGIERVMGLWARAGKRPPAAWDAEGAVGEVLDTWTMLLADVPDRDLAEVAVTIARGASPWWPTVGDVLALVRREPTQLDPAEVWGRVKPRLNAYREPADALADAFTAAELPGVLAAIETVGGWRALCASSVAEEPHTQRRLAEAYRVQAQRAGYLAEVATAGRLLELRRGIGQRPPVEGERPGLVEWVRGGGGR